MSDQPRALVTGASGYVGSHVALALRDAGWSVAGLTRGGRQAGRAGIEMIRTDGTFESVLHAVEAVRPTVVFHLAAAVIAVPRPEQVDELIRSNVLLAAHLTEAMLVAGASCLVNTGTYWQFAPDGTPQAKTLYAATKQAADAIVEYGAVRGLRVATLILHDVYGPTDPRQKLLAQLADAEPDSGPIDLGSGTQLMDYVYVDDVVRAYVAAAAWVRTQTVPRHERFVVRGHQPRTLRAVVELLAAARGAPLPVRWGTRPRRDHDIETPWLGGTPVPGWRPVIGLEEGLGRVVAAAKPRATTG